MTTFDSILREENNYSPSVHAQTILSVHPDSTGLFLRAERELLYKFIRVS